MASEQAAAEPRRLVLILEYDGTAYCGSQFQKNGPSIQGELEGALAKLTGEAVRVKLAGRTDAGVHARGQIASFVAASPYRTEEFVQALNHYLPEDIAVRAAAETSLAFDVRRHAASRAYRYTIFNGRVRSPLRCRYSWHVPQPLDVTAMQDSARCLVGRHDFASFAPPTVKSTWREVTAARVSQRGKIINFEMEATAFLPHQVRRTAGALVQVGLGRLPVEQFVSMIDCPRPGMAGPAAPPEGLCLIAVRYEGMEFGDGCPENDEDL